MSHLDNESRARILACMVEGMGIRPTARATGVSVNAVQRLIRAVGPMCQRLHDQMVRNLECTRVECDEVWQFCYAREKNVPEPLKGTLGYGDVWVWAGICATSKIVPSWYVGRRNTLAACTFLRDLGSRMAGRIELNTDGHNSYWAGLSAWDGPMPDYARVIKVFGTPSGMWNAKENRYQQPVVTGVRRERICGNPDTENASTSYAERLNLGLRMANRKMARLTNGHAKKLEMLTHSLAIHYTFYNFCKRHESLGGQTPAQANGLTDRRWTALDLINLVPEYARCAA